LGAWSFPWHQSKAKAICFTLSFQHPVVKIGGQTQKKIALILKKKKGRSKKNYAWPTTFDVESCRLNTKQFALACLVISKFQVWKLEGCETQGFFCVQPLTFGVESSRPRVQESTSTLKKKRGAKTNDFAFSLQLLATIFFCFGLSCSFRASKLEAWRSQVFETQPWPLLGF